MAAVGGEQNEAEVDEAVVVPTTQTLREVFLEGDADNITQTAPALSKLGPLTTPQWSKLSKNGGPSCSATLSSSAPTTAHYAGS